MGFMASGLGPSAAARPLSATKRQRSINAHNFATHYIEVCRVKRLRPLPVICVTLPQSLDFTIDRVKADDWEPILNCLSLDRSLKSVSIRSKYQHRKPLEEIGNCTNKTRGLRNGPTSLTHDLLVRLSHSVAQCVRNSLALTCLELEGIPLSVDCLIALCVGLESTVSLQHLSLRRCNIGDNSCAMICQRIVDVRSIRTLNLSQCDLSSCAGPALASALSRQQNLLFHDTWKDSLRYRQPDLESMAGLRRLTLNGNPHLGDSAVVLMIDCIQDNWWVKAIDLRNCGLTDAIGNPILDLLDHNSTLEVVDVRLNVNLSDNIVQDIEKRLEMNRNGSKPEFRPLKLCQKSSQFSEGMKSQVTNEMSRVARVKRAVRNAVKIQGPPWKPPSLTPAQNGKIFTPYPAKIIPRYRARIQPKPAKLSFHLDLQSKIKSTQDDTWKLSNHLMDSQMLKNMRKTVEKMRELDIQLKNAVRQLSDERSDASANREKFKKEILRYDMELKQERARRRATEIELETVKRKLTDLETKQKQSHALLFRAPKSADGTSTSDEFIEDFTINPSTRWRNEQEPKSDIKRQIIRQTKSENSKINSNLRPTRFSKSDGYMQPCLSSLLPYQFAKIGDHPDSSSSCQSSESYPEKSKFSPRERARAIFSQIINGDVILDLESRLS